MKNWSMRFLLYSIVGVLLNRAQKNKGNEKTGLQLPNFPGLLEVKHYLTGRIRLYVPIIKGDKEKIELLVTNFKKIDGVYGLEINPILGTILVQYDDDKLQPILIIGIIIKLLGIEDQIKKEPKSIVSRESQNISQAINLAVYNKTNGLVDLKDILLISFSIIGLYKMKNKRGAGVSGATLLWWAYSLLTHRRE